MIDLTPLDVRNKRGDFKKLMRGYDPGEVDIFLELVAERLESLVRENLQLKERTGTLQQQVSSQLGREQAVQDALVTAQELRADIRAQSEREAESILKEAETEARRMIAEAEAQVRGKLRGVERRVDGAGDVLTELERRRSRFLKEFRQLLERELDVVEVEERRTPHEERTIDLDLGPGPVAAAAAKALGLESDSAVPAESPADPQSLADASATDLDSPGPAESSTETETAGGPESSDAPGPVAESGEVNDAGTASGNEPTSDDPGAELRAPPEEVRETGADQSSSHDEGSQVPLDTVGHGLPSELETPSFATREPETPPPAPAGHPPVEELSASMEAEAMAEAGAQVVEVTGGDADTLADVPRLEEVLAEAGAEVEPGREPVSSAPPTTEEIAPPRISEKSREELLLYLDPDKPKD